MSVAAVTPAAIFSANANSGRDERRTARVMRAGARCAAMVCALALCAAPAPAASSKVRITSLSDVSFGTLANLNVDAVMSQNVCLYSDTATAGYNVTASGTGSSGSFALSSATSSLPYDVQWSSSSGQTTGTPLTANVPLTGQVSSATQQTCNTGAASSASLIVILRSRALSSADAGAYTGTLTLLFGPE